MDFNKIKKLRLDNFSCLAEKIGLQNINKRIPRNRILYKFPVLVDPENREKMIRVLAENNIFVSKHWGFIRGLDKDIFRGTYELVNRMIAIPIDHRYDRKDMKRIAGLVKSYV